jgi:hypothetical protein
MAGSASADMIAHWTFDEDSGQTAYDSAGSNNGTIYGGATRVAGKIGGALSFNGTSSYVNVPDAPSLRFDQYDSFTIAYWAKPTSMATGCYAISKMRASGEYGVFGYGGGYYSPAGQFSFVTESSRLDYVNLATPTNTAPPDGSWYYVTAVYDNTNMKIYVNGELKGTDTFVYDTGLTVPTQYLCIGARAYDNIREHYFSGLIDDVRIYNNALTGSEIQQLYNVPEPATLLLLGLGAAIIRKRKA